VSAKSRAVSVDEMVNGSIVTILGSVGYMLLNRAMVDALGSAAGGEVMA
jgi:hypothetical protein